MLNTELTTSADQTNAAYKKHTVDFRYKRVGYVALNVTDIERTHAFATDVFGLDHAGTGPAGERLYRCGTEHHSVVLYPADEPAYVRAGWELESEEDVGRAFHHMQAIGLNPQRLGKEERAVLGLNLSEAFRVREPVNGVCFEYYARMQTVARPRVNILTNFQHFGHVGVATPKVMESANYLMDHFGFIASDYVGDGVVVFMRPFPVPDHHGFGYLPAREGKHQFNHLAFMVESIDDIGKLFNRIEAYNVPRAFGIGRHPTSGSIHLYINDPDGMIWEYTLGMEQFPEVGARGARYMSAAPEDFDLWGAKPKPSFAGAGKIIADGH
jgi:2,3-dihydroxy-p-cumate/2,3-dihydroxybenzoate 3,4-dioxygenase